jgi:hypothetical protein
LPQEGLVLPGADAEPPQTLTQVGGSSGWKSKIIDGQKIDKGIFHIKEKMKKEPTKYFRVDE